MPSERPPQAPAAADSTPAAAAGRRTPAAAERPPSGGQPDRSTPARYTQQHNNNGDKLASRNENQGIRSCLRDAHAVSRQAGFPFSRRDGRLVDARNPRLTLHKRKQKKKEQERGATTTVCTAAAGCVSAKHRWKHTTNKQPRRPFGTKARPKSVISLANVTHSDSNQPTLSLMIHVGVSNPSRRQAWAKTPQYQNTKKQRCAALWRTQLHHTRLFRTIPFTIPYHNIPYLGRRGVLGVLLVLLLAPLLVAALVVAPLVSSVPSSPATEEKKKRSKEKKKRIRPVDGPRGRQRNVNTGSM